MVHDSLTPGKHFPKNMTPPDRDEILYTLKSYGFAGQGDIRLIDSSHGTDDLRLNYIIDRKWVLRVTNAPDMTEKRLSELDRLIGRYRDFGLICPAFLPDPAGRFIHERGGLTCCLSEYIDLATADDLDLTEAEKDALMREVYASVAGFAERYRDTDLIDTMGMYSLFDLSPFDKAEGIDEKQQNFNSLCDVLRGIGETALTERLEKTHALIRGKLKAVYQALPRCVFQADENLSNVLVNENRRLAGLIDFNLAGTEVIVNQFANLGSGFDEDITEPIGAGTRFDHALQSCRKDRDLLLGIYHATEEEKQAMAWYTWIALIAGWPQVCFFLGGLKKESLKGEILGLLDILADPDCLARLRIQNVERRTQNETEGRGK